jgi:hypothetical protein
MKTQSKKGSGLNLPKRNKRWRWMVGATAATAAGVTTSQASTITLNLVGNFISVADGNHLNPDVTGDGHPDLTITDAFAFHSGTGYRAFAVAAARLNGVYAFASFSINDHYATVMLGSHFKAIYTSELSGSVMGSVPIFFKDLHINGGRLTKGSLEVTVFTAYNGNPKIQLDSVTYNSNLPDQGSSRALLAMGAGGVLAMRRWRTGERRSESRSVPATTL